MIKTKIISTTALPKEFQKVRFDQVIESFVNDLICNGGKLIDIKYSAYGGSIIHRDAMIIWEANE